MKKCVSMVLAVALLFVMPVVKTQATEKYGEYEYDVLSDGTIEIVRYYEPMYDVEHLVIPETIEGYTVTSLGGNAFSYCGATTIVIPDTVTTIKRYTFDACRMKNIKLSNNLKVIEKYAFLNNGNLERIELPDGLLEIEDQAFMGCKDIDCIIVPASLQTVGWEIFNSKEVGSVYYKGTKSQWDELRFFKSNVASSAMVHYDFDLQMGDMNGDGIKNMLDALYLYATVSGEMDLASVYLLLADIDRNAQVNTMDSLGLYRQASGENI